jgi:hypothetical protein
VPRTRQARDDRRTALFFALSLVVHILALWQLAPPISPFAIGEKDAAQSGAPLVARMQPPAAAEPEPAPSSVRPPTIAPPPSVRRPVIPPVARAEPRAAPPILDAPVPSFPSRPLPPITPPEPLPLPAEPPPLQPAPRDSNIAKQYADLSAYVAAQRRARGEPADGPSRERRDAASGDSESARRDRVIAENLASINAPTFGDAKNSGGLFQITRLGYNDAEFTFFGWNTDIRRRASQRIEVRRGDESDIRLAVVRRMIAIIRQYEQEDFLWRSNRLGRDITLSARPADTQGLEDFLLREFF